MGQGAGGSNCQLPYSSIWVKSPTKFSVKRPLPLNRPALLEARQCALKEFHGGGMRAGLLEVVCDFAIRQRLLQFSNLCLCEVGVAAEKKILQLREIFQSLYIGQFIVFEIQKR